MIALREPVGETYVRLALPHGVELPASRVGEAFGRILRQAPPMVFPDAPPERVPSLERSWWREVVRQTFRAADGTARFADFEAYFDALFAHFAEPAAWQAAPGARECLADLRREGRRTGVASNFDHRLQEILEGLGLAKLLDLVLTPAQARAAKPQPRFFAAALEALGVAAPAALYVGDDAEADVAAAQAAGLRAVRIGGPATLASIPERIRALEQELPE